MEPYKQGEDKQPAQQKQRGRGRGGKPKGGDADKKQEKKVFAVKKTKDEDCDMSDTQSVAMSEFSESNTSNVTRGGGRKRERRVSKEFVSTVEAMAPLKLADKINKVYESSEKGFNGDAETWFDEERYQKPKGGVAGKANFDEANKHDYYFNSYSSHHIHEEMLKDRSRTLAYQNAIEANPIDFKDKIVLDIGCGTGILSMFAARAGAKHVYAVDNAEIALFAREIVKNNGFADKITVYKGKVEEIDFPFKEGEVDIIISEWMGYFLLYESMLDCVLWARDKFLNKQTGKMLPDRATMHIAAIEDSDFMGEKKQFWSDVYGVDMSIMSRGVFKDPMVDTVPTDNIMSDSCKILDLDLVNMKQKEVNFSNFYSLKMNYNDKVHAFVVWFDTVFSNLTKPVTLSTSPYSNYTHWKQCVLYLERPIQVKKGEEIYGSLACRQDKTNFRDLNIKMSCHLQNAKVSKHFDMQYKFK